jgi:hypothetical protein
LDQKLKRLGKRIEIANFYGKLKNRNNIFPIKDQNLANRWIGSVPLRGQGRPGYLRREVGGGLINWLEVSFKQSSSLLEAES